MAIEKKSLTGKKVSSAKSTRKAAPAPSPKLQTAVRMGKRLAAPRVAF
jgi:hypothetical protein